MTVMKFGGTSVADAEAMARCIEIIRDRLPNHPVVVVSALSKVTDALYRICDAARNSDFTTCDSILSDLRERHLKMAAQLIHDADACSEAQAQINIAIDELSDVCRNINDDTDRARIYGMGERMSSILLCRGLNAAGISTGLADARAMIVTHGPTLKAEPLFDDICSRVPQVVAEAMHGHEAVVTQGFVGADASGAPTILGRGGSDYSASLIGMALDAGAIEIWTDVDGVRTTDPRRVTNTRSIDRLSFDEAAQMAHFGAKVLHPLTIQPAVAKNIPVYVLNSMNPSGTGTVIVPDAESESGVKAVTFKENILMLNIFSPRMVEVPGFLSRVFAVFADHNVSVDLISTSEANISVTVDSGQDIEGVVRDLSGIAQVMVFDDKSQVSIIGKNVVKQRGLLRWAMTALNNITIYMISQDASLVNYSLVIPRKDLDEVILELHRHFFEFE